MIRTTPGTTRITRATRSIHVARTTASPAPNQTSTDAANADDQSTQQDPDKHEEDETVCGNCVAHITRNIDHFCAKDVGARSNKCSQCIKLRKGRKDGGCVALNLDELNCCQEYDAFVNARAEARTTRDSQSLHN
ncbi:hypothetical protein F4861DRAFT_540762 [Xylaria intraflava]|nr:hypothetical protein F4861DRAFT_540762 [Xylaria intraflava]